MSVGAKPATCETCPFFKKLDPDAAIGLCKRFPPHKERYGTRVFYVSVEVDDDDFCGEHPGRSLLPDLIANAIKRTSLDIERRAR